MISLFFKEHRERKNIFLKIVLFFAILFIALPIHAQSNLGIEQVASGVLGEEVENSNSPDCDGKCASGNDAECSVDCDPLGQCKFAQTTNLTSQDVRTVVARVINIVLGLLGTIAIIIVIIAGFKWMTAGGNEEQVTKAKALLKSRF